MAHLVKLGKLKPGGDILAEHLCENLSDDYLVLTSFNFGREVDVAVLAPQALFILDGPARCCHRLDGMSFRAD
jgi:hypothetical protein